MAELRLRHHASLQLEAALPSVGNGGRESPKANSRVSLEGGYGSLTYPCRAFHRKYFSKAILAAWDCGPGIITPRLRGGSILSARITTPLFPASMMHTAGMSAKFSSLEGSCLWGSQISDRSV